jgi:hypothetical protein
MATASMMSAPGASADPGEEPEGGYKICIAVDGQGAITVGVENENEPPEGAEPSDGSDDGTPPAAGAEAPEDEEAEMSDMKPAASIKEALTMALEIYKSNGGMGQMTDTSGNKAAFQSGFSGA